MISEVTITLSGDAIPTFTAIGASVNYGINRIPTATVQLDPSVNNLLCDFDSIRRTKATLTIETTNGCIYFDGLIDGLSFSQSPGNLSTSMVLKHPFQLLTEMYPRIIGVHPGSTNIFQMKNLVNIDYNGIASDALLQSLTVFEKSFNRSNNLVDFAVDLAKAAVSTQAVIPLVADDGKTAGLHKVVAETEVMRKNLADQVLALLNDIDTSATKGMIISAGSKAAVDKTIQSIAMMRDNIFSNLVRELSELGCVLIIGSRKAYIVPEATYLRIPKIGPADRKQRSDLVNIIYPAEYTSFVFNDNGFVNLRGVYVMHDANSSLNTAGAGNLIDMGIYVDETASGNIYTTTLPAFVSYGLVYAAGLGAAMQNRISGKKPLFSKKVDSKTVIDMVKGSFDEIQDIATRNVFMNQWAQMEYCRMKYDDRSGSISSVFNNNWAPGMVGTLYTREPGTWLDYFVTDVNHSFSLSAPNGGSATTNIAYKGGRVGTTSDVGLDELTLYGYDYKEATVYGNKFLADIAT